MNYVTWEELEDITNIILDDVFEKTDFIYQSNWNFDGNIKHEYYPGIYENHFCNVPIEYQWTKWKILEWLQEAWEVLISYEICNYWNKISRLEVLITYLSLISLYFSYFIDWQDCLFHNYIQYLDILKINANELKETITLNSQYNFLNNLDNNKITNFQSLWCLIIEYQKTVLQVLAKRCIENLYLSVSKSAELELDEDYIYYSLEDFYKSEYYFQRNETEKLQRLKNAISNYDDIYRVLEDESVSKETTNTNRVRSKIDENYIYYLIYKIYNVKYYCQSHELEHLINKPKIELFTKKIAKIFDGTIFNSQYSYIDKEKNKLVSEINSKSPFSDFTSLILEKTNYVLLSNSNIEEIDAIYSVFKNEIEKPFSYLCKEAIKKLPNYILSILEIQYKEFSVFNYSSQIEHEFKVVSNVFTQKFIVGLDSKCLYCSFSSQQELQTTEIINLLQKYVYSYLNNYSVNYLNITIDNEIWKISINNFLTKSSDDLINFIVESFNYLFPLTLIATFENPLPAIEEHLKIWKPKYKLEKYVDRTGISYNTLNNWIKTLQRKKQIIFQGSPGTGKTFIAENIAQYLIGGTDGFYETIQFHPAYTYEDFIQGIRPQTNNGQLEYNLVSGRFLEFCSKAETCKDNCILIIDEINRANLSQVFGELMYLLEYRDKEIALAGSDDKFKIPGNVYIIGTMNTADRSIALVDFALRRRFAFIKVEPNYEIIRQFHQESNNIDVEGLISVLERINRAISDRDYFIGISYFLTENLAEDLENIWCLEIETYLEEYFYNAIDRVDEFRWENVKEEIINI